MNDKFKKIMIPFILMMILDLGIYYLHHGSNFGGGLSPHVGLLVILGLLFGPYGAFGAVVANLLCDLIRGYYPILSILSAIFSFGVSYLGYKLWYDSYKGRPEVSKPKLNNTSNVILFFGIILVCGALYSLIHGKLFYLLYPDTVSITTLIELRYFLNFINSSAIFGIVGIWLSTKINFVHIPEKSEKEFNLKLYKILGILLILSLVVTFIIDYSIKMNNYRILIELVIIAILLFSYLRKPITSDIYTEDYDSIPEAIMNIFLLTTLFMVIFGIILASNHTLITAIDNLLPISRTEVVLSMMLFMDILMLIFLIPSLTVLKYIERKVIEPILSFAKIQDFIHENEKIESDGLVKIYSKYINETTEIGTLARSYTDLIKFNNNYIENIHKIEGEKERIKAELEIATKIQASNLPTEPITTNNYLVDGYSKPAKEVGGDFFDYYELDNENLAIVIGDASGKGVPAAILAMTTQVLVKQLLKTERDPSKVLYLLNNLLCEHNSEAMFITLWLGIYNKRTKKVIFSNAGHEPPLVKENNEFIYPTIDSGIVLGIMEDYEYITEEKDLSQEIVLYTDGITDANNNENEMYGKDNLSKFFNKFKNNNEPIEPLLNEIKQFTKDTEQFDDMTLLYLKIRND